ncbi:hypothetical protein LINPERPRIM_LOCUS14998 [Linum perenne]
MKFSGTTLSGRSRQFLVIVLLIGSSSMIK